MFCACALSAETSFTEVSRFIPSNSMKPLYEAAFLLLLFLGLLFFAKKCAFPLYLIGYGAGRFLLEFLRGDDRGSLLPGLSPAQAIALLLIALGWILLAVRAREKRRRHLKD